MAAWWWSPRPVTRCSRRPSHPRDRRGGHLAGAGYPGGAGLLLGYHVRRPGRCVEHRGLVRRSVHRRPRPDGRRRLHRHRADVRPRDLLSAELPYTVSFDLVDPGGTGTRDLRIGSSLAAFPVWAFGTQGEPGGSVRVELPQGYTPDVQGSAMSEGELPGGGVLLAAQLERPLAFFAYVSAERPGAFANRTMNLDVHGTRAQLLIRAWDDDPAWDEQVTAAAPRSAGAPGPDRGRLPGQRPAQRGRGRDLEARRVRGHLQPRDRRDPGALRRRRLRDPS